MRLKGVTMTVKKRKRILVVDDDPDIVRTTMLALQTEGYEVEGAGDGEGALEKIKENTPDLILLDLLLPGQYGFQLAQRIKSIGPYKHIPIIVLSCRTDSVDKRAAARCGVIEYIEKPIDLDRLLFSIQDILQT